MKIVFFNAKLKKYEFDFITSMLLRCVCVLTFSLTVIFYADCARADTEPSPKEQTEQFKKSIFLENNEKNATFGHSTSLSRSNSSEGVPASYYLQVLFSLILIVALIVAAGWFVKRLNVSSMKATSSLKIESSLAIGQKEKLLILRIENERILLGVTPHHINFLHKLENSTDVDNDTGTKEHKHFAEKLNALLVRGVK
ncbi:MAG TPA: flagellar biosynthetic protein FliO [Pseudomonadales bacterium]|nr:flagellar biosynthetic protein FliO [Pseudomonadales bacterium]